MNKREKEVIQYQLDKEKAVLKKLEQQYQRALNDIINKTKILQADIDMLQTAGEADDRTLSMVRSKVYQKQYQQALQQQIRGVLDKLHSDEYSTIQGFLNGCYEDGFIGAMYSLQAQGIPIITPIDTSAAVKAVQLDSKVVEGYYKHLGVDFDNLKKVIPQEVSRGIASSLPYTDIARNLHAASKSGLNNAKRIARTEGHRIQQQSAEDARQAAKKKGADVVKQWDASLDSRTRDSHRRVDGEIRENDEKFSNGLMYAGDPSGDAAEVINCRCVTLTRARWALDEEELETLKERAEYFGLDKTENFEDYKEKYLKAAAEQESQFGVRYGKDATEVDFDYINSTSYQAKFSGLTDKPKTNESVLEATKTILQHCDGTEHEDIYLIDMNGKVISKVTDSVSKLGVNYTDDFKDALATVAKNNTPVIAIHNHPHGTPPSPDDFRKAYENKYTIGLAVGHNGQVYSYANNSIEISLKMADEMAEDIDFLYRMGWDIDRASKKVYDDYGLNYTILEGAD